MYQCKLHIFTSEFNKARALCTYVPLFNRHSDRCERRDRIILLGFMCGSGHFVWLEISDQVISVSDSSSSLNSLLADANILTNTSGILGGRATFHPHTGPQRDYSSERRFASQAEGVSWKEATRCNSGREVYVGAKYRRKINTTPN